MCYNGSSKSAIKCVKSGAEMKLFRYSLICVMCVLLLMVTGCKGNEKPVVNTQSGVVINSNDFTGGFKERVSTSQKIKQVSQPTAKSTGRVIDLGGGYEKIEMGPLFDSI